MREMKISFQRIPIDLVLCLLGSVILIPLALFEVGDPVRVILGIPFLLFIPGYVLVFVLFPFIKTEESIGILERIGLSFGASVAIVPLIGLVLNFSPWGIHLQPLLLLVSVFIFSVGLIAVYRWFATIPEERFCVSFKLSFPSFEDRVDKVLSLVLAVLIIISVILLVYVVVVPKVGEKFTDFYVLGVNGTADQYPENLSLGENGSTNVSIILGIINHEYRDITYTVQVWLVNQSTSYNISVQKNETVINNRTTVINHMWLVYEDKTINLKSIPVNLGTPQNSSSLQNASWEEPINFSINRTGFFKLVFLLFTASPGDYDSDVDYRESAEEIMHSAYRNLHLWVNVN